MSRYFVKRPRAEGWCGDDLFDDERGGFAPSITVDEHVAVDTGIMDADGNSIWRAPNPVGFGRDDEW